MKTPFGGSPTKPDYKKAKASDDKLPLGVLPWSGAMASVIWLLTGVGKAIAGSLVGVDLSLYALLPSCGACPVNFDRLK